MKKRGLFVTTLIMLVAVVVSLSTATYAWFTSNAEVSIQNLQISTQASAGLEIARVVNFSGSTFTWGSGTDGGNSGFGSAYIYQGKSWNNKDVASQEEADKVYGVTGNGVLMYDNADAGNTLESITIGGSTMDRPAQLKAATDNVNFFRQTFAIRNTDANAKTIVITGGSTGGKFTNITAVGDATKVGICGSLRVAIFATATNISGGVTAQQAYRNLNPESFPSDQESAATYISNYAKLAWAPFAQYKFDGASLNTDGTLVSNNQDVTYLIPGSGNAPTAGSKLSTDYGDKFKVTLGGTLTDSTITLAENVPSGDYVFITIVIWFEGEDAECAAALAGGGFSANFYFSTL